MRSKAAWPPSRESAHKSGSKLGDWPDARAGLPPSGQTVVYRRCGQWANLAQGTHIQLAQQGKVETCTLAWQSIHSWCRFFTSRGSVSSSRHITDLVPLNSEGTHSVPDDGYDNLTAAQCRAFAEGNKARAKQPGISKKRATVLMNISRTYSGLASQLEILAGDKGEM
jgi:hypothetical protein